MRTPAGDARIGPGRLVLVVGPSGAGKDTLMAGARTELADRADIVFPQRVITRPPHPSERFMSTDETTFEAEAAAGHFALSWSAHGLRYGVPSGIDQSLRAGQTVVVNTSRSVVALARGQYRDVCVVLVTAPEGERARRLAARGRETADGARQRLEITLATAPSCDPDIRIENVGPPDIGIAMLVRAITAQASPMDGATGQAPA
jgi:ribose 1,5-bisphosphokinase